MSTRKTIIITGDRGSGKTHFISNLFEFLSLFENQICGFVSKGTFDQDGQKEFILKDLVSGTEMPLSCRSAKAGYHNAGRFWFNPEALEYGGNIINRGIEDLCRIMIIDEIGPVELAGGAWHKCFVHALKKFQGILIFTTRESLIEKLIEKYGIHEAFIDDIRQTTPRKTGDSILSMMKLQHQ